MRDYKLVFFVIEKRNQNQRTKRTGASLERRACAPSALRCGFTRGAALKQEIGGGADASQQQLEVSPCMLRLHSKVFLCFHAAEILRMLAFTRISCLNVVEKQWRRKRLQAVANGIQTCRQVSGFVPAQIC